MDDLLINVFPHSGPNIVSVPIKVDENKFKVVVYDLTDFNKDHKNASLQIYYNVCYQYIDPKQNLMYIPLNSDQIYVKVLNQKFGVAIKKQGSGFYVIFPKKVDSFIEFIYSDQPIVGEVVTVGTETESKIPLFKVPRYEFQKIPKKIFQTGFRKYEDLGIVANYSEIWKKLNPDYEFHYYTDDDCYQYLKKEYGEKIADNWKQIEWGAVRADIFRVLIIADEGGIYCDLGIRPYLPLTSFIKPSTEILVCKNNGMNEGKHKLFNGIFGFIKDHPFIVRMKKDFINILSKYKIQFDSRLSTYERRQQIFNTFGPAKFGSTFKDHFKMTSDFILMSTELLTIIEHNYNGKRRLFRSLNNFLAEKVPFNSEYYRKYNQLVSNKGYYGF
jgi:hypothetical protein